MVCVSPCTNNTAHACDHVSGPQVKLLAVLVGVLAWHACPVPVLHTSIHAGQRRVLWHNMREEPVLYINGKPYVVREADQPFCNVEYTGEGCVVLRHGLRHRKHKTQLGTS